MDENCRKQRGYRPRRWGKCCAWQANIRANGWLVVSSSYRGLFEHLLRTNGRPCTSPRRNQCRNGARPMRPARWNPSHSWFLWVHPAERPPEPPSLWVSCK